MSSHLFCKSVLPVRSRRCRSCGESENALVSYVIYVWKTLWPTRLAVFYPHPNDTLAIWEVIFAVLLLVAVTAAAIVCRNQTTLSVNRMVLVSRYARPGDRHSSRLENKAMQTVTPTFLMSVCFWLWYGSLIDVATVRRSKLQVAMIHRGRGVSNRSLWYVTSLCAGLLTGATAGLFGLVLCGDVRTTMLLTIISAISASTAMNWTRRSRTLKRAARIRSRQAGCPLRRRFSFYANEPRQRSRPKGQSDEAMLHYDEAIKLQPYYADAYYNRGSVLFGQGRVDEAIADWEKTLQMQPSDARCPYRARQRAFAEGFY